MYKLISCILSVVLLLSLLASCVASPPPSETEETTAAVVDATTKEESRYVEEQIDEKDVISMFSLTTRANTAETIRPSDSSETVPPGGLYDPADYPEADQSLVGKTIYTKFFHDESILTFFYSYDRATDTERLIVPIIEKNPLLIIGETKFGGLEGLAKVVREEKAFSLKILSLTTIDSLEGVYMSYPTGYTFFSAGRDEDVIDLQNPPVVSDSLTQCIGVVGYQSYTRCYLAANVNEEVSEDLNTMCRIYWRTVQRFGLDSLVKIRYSDSAT